jgi:5-methylcytosine-specific restriction endonuclease McrA
MGEIHRSRAYLKFASIQRKRLMLALPSPCPRCGLPIFPGDAVDLDHLIPVSQDPSQLLNPGMVRLAHRACNRRAGQKITAQRRRKRINETRLPGW